MNVTTIDLELIRPNVNGVTYGGMGRVFARTPTLLLVWFKGANVKGGGYDYIWSPATMRVLDRKDHGSRGLSRRICQGERLHQRIFTRFADQIDEHLGEGFHKLLEIDKTVVVGDNEPFSKYGHEMPITGHEFGYEHMKEQESKRAALIAAGYSGLELEMLVQRL